MKHPRRRDKFWMVAYANEGIEANEEVPFYFPTRREAVAAKVHRESNPDYFGDELLVVKPADIPWDDVEWPWSDGSQW